MILLIIILTGLDQIIKYLLPKFVLLNESKEIIKNFFYITNVNNYLIFDFHRLYLLKTFPFFSSLKDFIKSPIIPKTIKISAKLNTG